MGLMEKWLDCELLMKAGRLGRLVVLYVSEYLYLFNGK